MKIQHGLKKDYVLKKFVLGVHPIIHYFVEKLKVHEIIGTYVQADKRRKVETEHVLCLLIHNFLTSPTPLYEIQDWLKPIDAESVGLTNKESNLIYDERVARALDDFYDSKHKDIFFHLSLRIIKIFELDCTQIHADTTTVTFSGKYTDWDADEKLAHGHNKDHRPDLKQLVLGLTVTADGAVPLLHKIYDGNQTDDQVHIANHRRLQQLLSCSDFIYVADSKLASEPNLKKITQWGGRFVTVMPRTWKEDEKFRTCAKNGNVTWKHLLSRPNSRKPKSKTDHYHLAEGSYKTKQGYHLHWIQSTQKAEQDAETRAHMIDAALGALRSLQPKLNKYTLKTRNNIESSITLILKKYNCLKLVDCNVHEHQEYEKNYQTIGRPTATTPANEICKISFSISFNPNAGVIEEESKMDGIFPLITNLDVDAYHAKRVLEIYKYQPFIEKRFSQIKTYQQVAPVYMKNAKRSVALLHMQVMALMVASLIERQLRLAMKKEGIKTLPIYPEERKCKAPTMFDLTRLFKEVERYEVTQSNELSVYPAELNKTQKEVLKLLGMPISRYH